MIDVKKFRHKDLEDKRIDTLSGLVKGIVADGVVNQKEAEFLHTWLAQNSASGVPFIQSLLFRLNDMLVDGYIYEEETVELFDTLILFAGDKSELGEMAKPSNLPLDKPEPVIDFKGKSFLFTGTFGYGSRKECKALIDTLEGINANSVVLTLDYLVIGNYVTEAWKFESFGRKIQKAMENRENDFGVRIISEGNFMAQAGVI